jgi:hypothetical protein
MSGWRQFAEIVRQGEGAGTMGTKGTKPTSEAPFVPFVPIVPKALPFNPASLLREWHGHLVAIDDCHAPAGYSIMWWQQACDDARWIYENFAARAVRDGWSAHDMFGILPWRLGWGGICDRLRGARNLKMDGDRAVWSNCGIHDQFVRGAGDDLVGSGLIPIWKLGL